MTWYNSLWLWRWLPHSLLKHQSLSTTVLFRTTFTWTIMLHLLVNIFLFNLSKSNYKLTLWLRLQSINILPLFLLIPKSNYCYLFSPVQCSTCSVNPDTSSPCDFTTEPPSCLITSSLGKNSIKYLEKLRTRRMALYVSQVKSSLK